MERGVVDDVVADESWKGIHGTRQVRSKHCMADGAYFDVHVQDMCMFLEAGFSWWHTSREHGTL